MGLLKGQTVKRCGCSNAYNCICGSLRGWPKPPEQWLTFADNQIMDNLFDALDDVVRVQIKGHRFLGTAAL